MNDSDFESLRRGLAQVEAYEAGARKGYAVHEPVNVRELRLRLKLSQVEFAGKLHISVATVRDWEQGRRSPDGPARTLLGMVEVDPKVALDLLEKMSA